MILMTPPVLTRGSTDGQPYGRPRLGYHAKMNTVNGPCALRGAGKVSPAVEFEPTLYNPPAATMDTGMARFAH